MTAHSRLLGPRRLGGLAAVAALGLAGLAGCGEHTSAPAWPAFGGDPARGAVLANRYGCGACHQIPGVEGADGEVGPSLGGFARRTMIAGVLPNTPGALVGFLRRPQEALPGGAMPDVGLTDQQARDIAAYLYKAR